MAPSDEDYKITKWDLINSAIGGAIFFIAAILLSDLAEIFLRQILVYFGIIGVIAFDSFKIAKAIIIFGVAYLLCGFFGGLFTGYRCEKRVNLFLLITASIGFVALVALSFFAGRLSLPTAYVDILIPALAGDFIGVYLGGYTIIWSSREEEPSGVGIELDEEDLKSQEDSSSSE